MEEIEEQKKRILDPILSTEHSSLESVSLQIRYARIEMLRSLFQWKIEKNAKNEHILEIAEKILVGKLQDSESFPLAQRKALVLSTLTALSDSGDLNICVALVSDQLTAKSNYFVMQENDDFF